MALALPKSPNSYPKKPEKTVAGASGWRRLKDITLTLNNLSFSLSCTSFRKNAYG